MARISRSDPDAALGQVVDLFWDRGFHDVCVEDIVHRTGLNRHSLYGRYGNKMGLFRAALDHYAQLNTAAVDEVLDGPGSALERIARLLELRLQGVDGTYWGAIKSKGCLAARTADELGRVHPELRQAIDLVGHHLTSKLTSVIAQGQELGELRKDTPATDLASLVVNCFMAPLAWDRSQIPASALLTLIT